MAIAGIAGLGSAASKTSGTTLSWTITNSCSTGTMILVSVACDNTATTDGDFSEISSVTDSGGNTYNKAKEYTNGQGAAAAGCTVSLWWALVTTALTTGVSTITVTFANTIDAKVAGARNFSVAANKTFEVEASTAAAYDNADLGSLDLTVANIEHLWARADAKEGGQGSYTNTTLFQGMSTNETTGGAADTNIALWGEYRIFTGTSNPSDPTWSTTGRDHASVYVAIKEVSSSTSWTATAALATSAVVSAVAVATFVAAAAIAASATVASSAVQTMAASTSIQASATVSANATRVANASTSISASATVAADGTLSSGATSWSGASAISASGTVSASAVQTMVASTTISASGSAAATAKLTLAPTAASSASATVAASAVQKMAAAAAISATGSLTATPAGTGTVWDADCLDYVIIDGITYPVPRIAVAAFVDADAVLGGGATVWPGTAAIPATGSISASIVAIRSGAAALQATATVSPHEGQAYSSIATASASATVSSDAVVIPAGETSALILTSGSVQAYAVTLLAASVQASASATVAADGMAVRYASASLAGSAFLSGLGSLPGDVYYDIEASLYCEAIFEPFMPFSGGPGSKSIKAVKKPTGDSMIGVGARAVKSVASSESGVNLT